MGEHSVLPPDKNGICQQKKVIKGGVEPSSSQLTNITCIVEHEPSGSLNLMGEHRGPGGSEGSKGDVGTWVQEVWPGRGVFTCT